MEPAEPLPDEAPVVTASREVVRLYSSPSLVNHCERSYLWAAGHGRLHGTEFDAELLYVAAMLHDLGLVRAFDNHHNAFEEAGGDVAWVFGAGAGWAPARRERVKEIIVRHMWDAVEADEDAESHLLNIGTGLDISGSRADEWPAEFRAEVVRLHPRLELPEEFLAAFRDQAGRKPSCAAAASVAGGIAERIMANPLDG